ncbi:IS3 family transposase [Priestia taiwanensis]|uniref:IS3 family transposase n=1 Tax=Priestia taiwanensis TaxID=1347902 RepID=UPI0035717329
MCCRLYIRIRGSPGFFSHFKSECFNLYSFKKADEVIITAHKYIRFYNYQRFQKKLNNLSPYKYRTQAA